MLTRVQKLFTKFLKWPYRKICGNNGHSCQSHYLSIFFLIFCSYAINAQVLINQTSGQEIDLNEAIYYVDKDIETRPSSGWLPYDATKPIQNHSSFWIKIDLKSNLERDTEYILYLHDLQQVSVQLKDHQSNTIQSYKTGVLLPLKDRSTPNGKILNGIGNSAQVHLKIPQHDSSIYIHISNTIENVFKPELKLYTREFWESRILPNRQRHLFIQGAIGGAMILISLYHLLIFFWRRDYPYLFYALYTISAALIIWHETGVSQTLFFTDEQLVQRVLQMTQALGIFTITLYFLFQRSFINLRSVLPKTDKFVLYVLVGLGIFNIIFYLIFKQQLTLYAHSFGFIKSLIVMVVGLGTLILIFRTGEPLAKIFTLGSSALFAGVFLNTLLALAIHQKWMNSSPFSGIYLSEAGILIEVIIFALGLGYRHNLIEKEKQRIENLDLLKTKFFTNISHEFRTPLTIISGISDQINGHSKEKELIQRNSKNLLNLVNQMLDLSHLDSKTLSVDMIQADIISYLKFLTESFYSMAEEKNVRLMFYSEVPSQLMDFDENKIQQIVYNLLMNAIKFTPEKGKIVLHSNLFKKVNSQCLQIKVQDTGLGIEDWELKHIFDRFYQTKSSSSQLIRGTGIGLALTKELVELLKGEIQVESTVNIGTTFIINLPITQKAALNTAHQKSFLPINDTAKTNTEISTHIDGQLVLVVEDNPDIVVYLKGLLSNTYQIEVATNGQEGAEKAKNLIPDIIISDVMMPKMDGNELCNLLKADDATSHIPIILLTARSTQEDKIIGLSGGADAYLTKPFNKKELLLRVENLLKGRQRLQVYYSSFVSQVAKKKSLKKMDPVFKKIINLIESRLDDDTLSVNEISAQIEMNRTQINRKMKALTGETTSTFITNMRMEKAKALLNDKSLNISEIAYKVGYKDPNYFTRAFTKQFGYSPTTLRE